MQFDEPVQDRILRFTPPLTVSTGEIGEGLAILQRVLSAWVAAKG